MARIIAALTQFFHPVTGKPLAYGKLRFLESGTNNTNKKTFKDAALTPELVNENPVPLDGGGNLALSVFGTGTYNVLLIDKDNVQLKQFDPVGATTSIGQFSVWLATETYDKGDIVRATDGEYYQSFINGNNNNNPVSSLAEWDLITVVKSFAANASGTVDAITVDFVPVMHSLADGNRVLVRSSGANTITTPTFAANGLTAKTIVKNGNQPLVAGDTAGEMDMVYNSSNDNWELLNPGINAISVKTTVVTSSDSSFDYTPGVKSVIIIVTGGGGGGGGVDGQGGGTAVAGDCGSGAGTTILTIQAPTGTLNITIGAFGIGGITGTTAGTDGGDSSVVGTGVNLLANGGKGGAQRTGSSGNSGANGRSGSDSSGGDINMSGGASTGARVGGGVFFGFPATGSSFWGGGTNARVGVEAATSLNFGAGGATTCENESTANYDGSDGGQGVVVIQEFF